MTSRLHILVPGNAHPQGSKRHVGNGRMIEASPHLKSWRATVVAHTVAAIIRDERQTEQRWPATGPCLLRVVFHFPRPKNHYRTGKHAGQLKDSAPREMQTGPDLDKLVRAIGDALKIGGAVRDDRQINVIFAAKRWTTDTAHTHITLETAT